MPQATPNLSAFDGRDGAILDNHSEAHTTLEATDNRNQNTYGLHEHTNSNGISHQPNEKGVPIAVVGFSFKFPQEATSSEGFWAMLTDKRCCMTDWPEDRLNNDAFYHPNSSRPDTVRIPSICELAQANHQNPDTFSRRSFHSRASWQFRCTVLLNIFC